MALLGHSKHRETGLPCKTFGCAEARPGLCGFDRWIRDEVNICPSDRAQSVIYDDPTIHLREFSKPLSGIGNIYEIKPT